MKGRIELWVPGPPQGKDRPRSIPGQIKPFTPTKTKKAEAAIVEAWRRAGEEFIPEEVDYWLGAEVTKVRVPIKMEVTLLVMRGPSHFFTRGGINTKGQRHPMPEDQKPDMDNALKLAMDAMNKRAYRDDVKIVTTTLKRRWSKTREGVLIVIEPETESGDWD